MHLESNNLLLICVLFFIIFIEVIQFYFILFFISSCLFVGTTGGILVLAFIVDLVVWYKAGSINFVDEQTVEESSAEEMTTLKSQDGQPPDNDYL